MNELEYIKYLKKMVKPGKGVIKSIGDDAAVLKYKRDRCLLFASDMLIEGVHFSRNSDPFQVGWKAVAVNLSDIAAMGGIPKYVVISLGVPNKKNQKTLKGIYIGAKSICDKYGVSIVGGDTNLSRHVVVCVSVLGEVEKNSLTRRDGACVSDLIFVTGCLGEGKKKHLSFFPRVKEARLLVKKFKVHSMIDVSDGFFIDLFRLCQASRVGAVIYESLLPVSGKTKNSRRNIEYGEDFELLFTLSKGESERLLRYANKKKYPKVTFVGKIVSRKQGLNLFTVNQKIQEIKPRGYVHF